MPIEEFDDYIEKSLSPRERHEPEAIARLRAEGRLLWLLSKAIKPSVTPRLVLRGHTQERGPWHRVERIWAPTLGSFIEHGRLSSRWIEWVTQSTFSALAKIHEAHDDEGPLDVVHADLSPANIAVDEAGARTVILDFDLAWWRNAPIRNDGAFRGTIGYVAPEVARGERPTVRSDLYSLAACLIHAVTGEAPRIKRDAPFAALLAEAGDVPLIDPTSEGYAIIYRRGRGHAAILECLAHEPEDRPRSAREVVERMLGTPLL